MHAWDAVVVDSGDAYTLEEIWSAIPESKKLVLTCQEDLVMSTIPELLALASIFVLYSAMLVILRPCTLCVFPEDPVGALGFVNVAVSFVDDTLTEEATKQPAEYIGMLTISINA